MAAAVKSEGGLVGEAGLWRGLGARWRQLFGDFATLGVSFEWHELAPGDPVRWDPSFHPGSVELCLNLAGSAEVQAGSQVLRLEPWTAGFYRQGNPSLTAVRHAGQTHQFITVEWSPSFLARTLDGNLADLHPVARAVLDEQEDSRVGGIIPLDPRQRALVGSLRHPPVLAAAQSLWYRAKAVELLGEFLFQAPCEEELFCRRHQRTALDRVQLATQVLRRDLANPPSLEELGREVGCSPFYLSRTFSKGMGMTVPQYLRQIRLDHAALLLREGRHNVTEAALAVGYNSLSHFSQAFHQRFGCCPGLYPVATVTQQAARDALSQPSGLSSPTVRP